MISRNLAKQPSPRGSFLSCPDPDLSTLQISLPQSRFSSRAASEIIASELTSSDYNSTSTHSLDHRDGQRKRTSTGKRVSRKARGVLGKVRAFHRIAAAKMSQSIKLDTSVQTIKRGLPEDNEEGLEGPGVAGDVEQEISAPGLEARSHNNVPPFLCQSYLG